MAKKSQAGVTLKYCDAIRDDSTQKLGSKNTGPRVSRNFPHKNWPIFELPFLTFFFVQGGENVHPPPLRPRRRRGAFGGGAGGIIVAATGSETGRAGLGPKPPAPGDNGTHAGLPRLAGVVCVRKFV